MTRSRLAIQTALQAAALLAATAAHAATLTTPPLHPDAGGRLACTAINVGRSITIGVQILDDAQRNVTDFVSTEWSSETDGILASVAAESNLPEARYCKVTIGGGGRSQVRAALEAFDANGVRTAIVEAR